MKKIGLVGGMGPESTMPYYLGILHGVRERVDPHYFPPLTIESVNVFEILDMCLRGELDRVADYLLEAILNLTKAGAEVAALTANTSHIVFDRIQQRSPIPLISIIDAVVEETKRREYRKIGLLGTVFTMNGNFYKKPFMDSGVEIVVPDEVDKNYVDRKISEELEYGIVNDATLLRFQEIIVGMKEEHGIEAVVLGCTELPILLNDENSPVPCLDTVKIHVGRLVEETLS